MKTIKIKNCITKEVLFELEKEDNSILDTLTEAVKQNVDLYKADLCGADLRRANLYGACLREADLYGANLHEANLFGTNLYGACLCRADLRGACLRKANLRGVDLREASLCKVDLYEADLCGADLYGATLYEANLCGAKNVPLMPFNCPSDGAFIGWKKIKHYAEDYSGEYLVKLEIPEDAKRSSATTNKCRCDKAKVLEITNISDNSTVDKITNTSITNCVYRVGEMVYPDSFDEDRWNGCSYGIHFFINKQEAIDYWM